MKYIAEIDIMPQEAILDPQGKAVSSGLANLGLSGLSNARIGKHVRLEVEAANEADAIAMAQKACDEMLCNKIMEYSKISVSEA